MAKGLDRTFGSKASDFFLSLRPEFKLPPQINFLQSNKSPEVIRVTRLFFKKFYDDHKKRILILGINPGRFGSGITGISFTDPIRLESDCGIANSFDKRPELSSDFIYRMIDGTFGIKEFYSRFFLTSVCPIGFSKLNKNVNYYDDSSLIKSSKNFIEESLKSQLTFGACSQIAICLGEGKNYSYLLKLNDEMKLFKEILPLTHPRFIMQYKRKEINEYIDKYAVILEKVVKKSSI